MRILGFLSAFIIIFSYLVYMDSSKTIYDKWSIVKGKSDSFFDENVTTIKLRVSKDSEDEVLVAYDSKSKGVYCIILEDFKEIYVCTPMILNKAEVSSEDYLIDIVKHSDSKKGFLAKIFYYNLAYIKKLNIETAALDFECLVDDTCKFISADNYIAFNYNILKRLKIMNDYEVN